MCWVVFLQIHIVSDENRWPFIKIDKNENKTRPRVLDNPSDISNFGALAKTLKSKGINDFETTISNVIRKLRTSSQGFYKTGFIDFNETESKKGGKNFSSIVDKTGNDDNFNRRLVNLSPNRVSTEFNIASRNLSNNASNSKDFIDNAIDNIDINDYIQITPKPSKSSIISQYYELARFRVPKNQNLSETMIAWEYWSVINFVNFERV